MGQPTQSGYSKWLLKKVYIYGTEEPGVPQIEYRWENYNWLIGRLWAEPFIFTHEMDINRVNDGYDLREAYLDEFECSIEEEMDFLKEFPISCFEVLVALSERMSYLLEGRTPFSSPGDCFTIMLRNLGLYSYDDNEVMEHAVSVAEVDGILTNWLYRRYDKLGRGSLFPLKKQDILQDSFYERNQQTAEIWYQMQAYLHENYPI